MMVIRTIGADGQSSQGPVESGSSVLRLQPDQAVLNQLTQRHGETLQVLLHLEMTRGLSLIYTVHVSAGFLHHRQKSHTVKEFFGRPLATKHSSGRNVCVCGGKSAETSIRVTVHLFKRGIVPEFLRGQAEIQWTHGSLLHQQRLELQVQTHEDKHIGTLVQFSFPQILVLVCNVKSDLVIEGRITQFLPVHAQLLLDDLSPVREQ